MKVLGIDLGKKRTGLSISNEEKSIAFPFKTVQTENIGSIINDLYAQNLIDTIVLGYPLKLNGNKNEMSGEVLKFKIWLNLTWPNLKVELMDERFTSVEATRTHLLSGIKASERKNKKNIDTTAATLILQNWLEKRSNGF